MRYEMHNNYNFFKYSTSPRFSHDKKLSLFSRVWASLPGKNIFSAASAYRRNGLDFIDFNLVLALKAIPTCARIELWKT